MKRSVLREQVFRLLFRVEFHTPGDMEEQASDFGDNDCFPLSDEEDEDVILSEKDARLIRERYESIAARLDEIDALINERTVGWDTSRMGKADLTVVRLAVFELMFDEAVPTGVAINEAVDLARKYGQDNSSSFVNGVLARFVPDEDG